MNATAWIVLAALGWLGTGLVVAVAVGRVARLRRLAGSSMRNTVSSNLRGPDALEGGATDRAPHFS